MVARDKEQLMFRMIKSWDNRGQCQRRDCLYGRTWTRRIQWLQGNDANVKLKMWDGTTYKEVMVIVGGCAQPIWNRFKAGLSIDDCVSILAQPVPKSLQSRQAAQQDNPSPPVRPE
jgi:hypothetical protein